MQIFDSKYIKLWINKKVGYVGELSLECMQDVVKEMQNTNEVRISFYLKLLNDDKKFMCHVVTTSKTDVTERQQWRRAVDENPFIAIFSALISYDLRLTQINLKESDK